MNDLLSDAVARIRNAYMARLKKTILPNSKFVRAVLVALEKEGYVGKFVEISFKELMLDLVYRNNKPPIVYMKRVSKPGKRTYSGKDFPPAPYTFGTYIVSTNKGIEPSYKARKENRGGELLLKVF